MSSNAMRFIETPVRTGTGALEITVRPNAMAEVGDDGQPTERAELREAPDVRLKMGMEAWYAFSFFLPSDFPIVDTRLVIARWKQSFRESWKNRSPMIALRYMGGQMILDVTRDRGQRRVFVEKTDLRNQWVDMVFYIKPLASTIIPSRFKEGRLQVWRNGRMIVDYQGTLGYVDDEDEIYFKLGLYRDHLPVPMRIVYDRFRRGGSLDEVSISALPGK